MTIQMIEMSQRDAFQGHIARDNSLGPFLLSHSHHQREHIIPLPDKSPPQRAAYVLSNKMSSYPSPVPPVSLLPRNFAHACRIARYDCDARRASSFLIGSSQSFTRFKSSQSFPSLQAPLANTRQDSVIGASRMIHTSFSRR